ncbi:hypothetical protein BFW01_g2073 [Lasiodiplodia theobromae]|nr:hypothetical protein BFW01_g2073 [Lasiodiplodia theobromae]
MFSDDGGLSLENHHPRANESRRRAPRSAHPRPPHPFLSARAPRPAHSPRSPTTRLSLLTLQAHISTALAIAASPATPPPSVTVTFTTHATLCHHSVTITCPADAASTTPIPDHCAQCTLHRATRAAKRTWIAAQDLFGALHWRTAAARREYCKARAREAEGVDGGDDEPADQGRSGGARKTGKTVAFADDVVEGSGRPTGAFARGRRGTYVPGRYAGDWVDTSGKGVTFTVFYGGNETEE